MSKKQISKSSMIDISKKISMNKAIFVRFVAIFVAVFLTIVFVNGSFIRVNIIKDYVTSANNEKSVVYSAGMSHYNWANQLMTHINEGAPFTATLDPTACAFGQFVYADNSGYSSDTIRFISVAESLHIAIHSAGAEITELDVMEHLTYDQRAIIDADIVEFGAISMDTQAMIDAYEKELKLSIYVEKVDKNISLLVSEIFSLIDMLDEQVIAKEEYLQTSIYTAMVTCALSMLFIVTSTISTLMFIKKQLIAPLMNIEEGVLKLSDGILDIDFIYESKTKEMCRLSNSLQSSVDSLKFVIDDIQESVDSMSNKDFSVYPDMTYPGDFKAIERAIAKLIDVIRDTMGEIQSSAYQVTTGAEQVSSGSQALAHGTMEQTSSVADLCTVVEDVAEKVVETAHNAENADRLGQVAVEVVAQSTQEMGQLMGAITEIQTSSSYIEKIIHTIDDIAFQTNILALNAAVEAARAGQAGRGFAVVADEVRNLAQKSAEAAQNTTALIETSLRAVERGTDLANSTNATFDDVVNNTEEILGVVAKISEATKEQLISIEKISNSVTDISAVVNINSATSEESAAASEELSSQANMMKSLISEFNLG